MGGWDNKTRESTNSLSQSQPSAHIRIQTAEGISAFNVALVDLIVNTTSLPYNEHNSNYFHPIYMTQVILTQSSIWLF